MCIYIYICVCVCVCVCGVCVCVCVCVCLCVCVRLLVYDIQGYTTWTNYLHHRQRPYISVILFLELQWANLWSVRALQLGKSTKGFPTRRVNFPAYRCLRLPLNIMLITHTQHVDENFIRRQKTFWIRERELTQDVLQGRQILFLDIWINASWKREKENDEDRE